MGVWRIVARGFVFAWMMIGCGGEHTEPPAVVDGGRALADADARADADAGADAEVDSAVAPPDGGGVCSVDECSARLGVPPVPQHPCGFCWAECTESGQCGEICYEAAECVFTSGCGPRCEPLCDTTADCLGDSVCVEGECVPPADGG